MASAFLTVSRIIHRAVCSRYGNERKNHFTGVAGEVTETQSSERNQREREMLFRARDATSPASTRLARFYLDASQAHKADSNLIEDTYKRTLRERSNLRRLYFSESFPSERSKARRRRSRDRKESRINRRLPTESFRFANIKRALARLVRSCAISPRVILIHPVPRSVNGRRNRGEKSSVGSRALETH